MKKKSAMQEDEQDHSQPERDLSLEQQHAVDLCSDIDERVVGITGGAGTGKTSVLGAAYKELKRTIGAKNVVLCAPTGRAAKRVQELTGISASTVHRLLEFPTPEEQPKDSEEDPPENKPKRNRWNPIEQKVVLVDEASMIGPSLYGQLMEALPSNGCIRFFGDNNQLPPVEDTDGESPFLKVLRRDKGNVTLTFNFRSDDYIVSNALRILEGRLPIQNDRFRIIYTESPLQYLVKFAERDFMRADHQIIMPTRKGNYGTQRINPALQIRFNGRGDSLQLDRYEDKDPALTIRGNDKFLWTKNDYALNVFNGEIGQVEWVDTENGDLSLLTPDRQIHVPARVRTYSSYHRTTISYDPRKNIELGYAVTTHKSQGSEFNTIIYCITGGQAYLLNRQNLYTAITRAKHQVIIISDRRAMGLSLRKAK